jgi:predicted flap endonuclease-1-like 5' DNA nuclease
VPAPDDLRRIEGIGPKIAGVLQGAGITTFEDLAGTGEQELRRILTGAGLTFAPSLPTWPRQARLLADGDEQGLSDLVATLTAGRSARSGRGRPASSAPGEDQPHDVTPADGTPVGAREPEPPAEPEPAAEPEPDDDLEQIEGIGPRIAVALRDAGIRSFRTLADCDVATLQAALEASGLRFAPSLPTWPRQAGFLAAGDRAGFSEYSNTLVAGRERGGRS